MAELGPDGGWIDSAEAWIALAPNHDTRVVLLDPVMLREAGNIAGQRVLDLGCGEGRFTRLLSARGATVVGLDPVRRLLDAARDTGSPDESYVQGGGEALPFADHSFNLVVAYLCLIDITDFRAAIRECARVLANGGHLLVANISNVASTSEGPVVDGEGHFLHYTVDRYLEERPKVLEWAGLRIRNWHRPLSAYMDAYLSAGLTLRRYLEPMPADASLRNNPRFESWFSVPTFDVMLWEKTRD
jgi:SAM-dependent methyltransferase